MDAGTWLLDRAALRFDHQAFACLDGCGFCCTYPPQVTSQGFQAIEEATGLRRVNVDPDGALRLPLQGGCGGCELLEERRCTAYELRPVHCRLFPFHVYFGRGVEVYADRVCPGLDPADDAAGADDLPVREALGQATAQVQVAALERHRRQAVATHGRFEENAREAGVWSDPETARRRAVEQAAVTPQAWELAREPFESEDLEQLPTLVLPGPGFTWRMWRWRDGEVQRLDFHEDGTAKPVGSLPAPARPEDLAHPVRETLVRLVGLECFVGAAFDLVDASNYTLTVADAVQELSNQVAASLALRAPLVEGEGLEVSPRWLAAAYEPEFFDLPTIGGWL